MGNRVRKLASRLAVLVATVLASSGLALAGPYTPGDVFVSVGGGLVREYTPGGVLVQTLNTTFPGGRTAGSLFDSAGNFYVANGQNIVVFNPAGAPFLVIAGIDGGTNSIAMDAAGNIYAGQTGGTQDILKLDLAGTVLAAYDVAVTAGGFGVQWIELGPLGLIFYTSGGSTIKKFHAPTNNQSPDIAVGVGDVHQLRRLPDATFLVAAGGDIRRVLGSSGPYSIAGQDFWYALALNPDGTSFWAGDRANGLVARFDIATGAVLGSFPTCGEFCLGGLSVFGGIGEVSPVPEPATILLVVVGALLVGRRLRHGPPARK